MRSWGANPNITVSSKFHSSYFKLRNDYNLIQISAKQTGELSYQLTDMLGSTGGKQIYYEYGENDDFTRIIEKFAAILQGFIRISCYPAHCMISVT